jgi:hypothetical protein
MQKTVKTKNQERPDSSFSGPVMLSVIVGTVIRKDFKYIIVLNITLDLKK